MTSLIGEDAGPARRLACTLSGAHLCNVFILLILKLRSCWKVAAIYCNLLRSTCYPENALPTNFLIHLYSCGSADVLGCLQALGGEHCEVLGDAAICSANVFQFFVEGIDSSCAAMQSLLC